MMDLADYDALLGEFYDSSIDNHSWDDCLSRLQAIYQANFVTLILDGSRQADKSLMLVMGGADRPAGIRLEEYPYGPNPFVNTEINQVFTVTDLMDEETWIGSAYYRDYCQPHGVYYLLGVDILPPHSNRCRLLITRPRSQPDFNDSERQFCTRLVPHLQRVLHIHALLARNESLSLLYSQAAGRLAMATFILDEDGQLLEANPSAQQLLVLEDGLKVVGGRLQAVYSGDNKRLYQSIKDTLAAARSDAFKLPEALSMSRPSGKVRLGLVIEPVLSDEWANGRGQPALVIYVRDAEGKVIINAEMAQQMFGLTPSESVLAVELANGASLKEAASSLGIRCNTARAHLRAIFSKTGVRRQTELVRIILNSVIYLGTDQAP